MLKLESFDKSTAWIDWETEKSNIWERVKILAKINNACECLRP